MNPEIYMVLKFGTEKGDEKTDGTNGMGCKEIKNSKNLCKKVEGMGILTQQ